MLSTTQITTASNTFKVAYTMAASLYAQAKMFGFDDVMALHQSRMFTWRNYAFILDEYTDDCEDYVNLDDIYCKIEDIPLKYLINCNGELS